MASLHIQDVCKQYAGIEVLKNIHIEIEHGEFLVLVGPSGCGKSTLLNMIAGLESISSGAIMIDRQCVNQMRASERDIAMVFQSFDLYPNMTVEQNISFGMEMRGVPKSQRQTAVLEVARMLQMEALLKRRPAQLSGGQRQRVAMGRALVRNPKIFLFDEPLSNLDAKLRVDMRTEIKRLHQRLGATIVYVTHDQIEAMTLASRIAVMHGGRLQQLATPAEIYQQPENIFVASFMGSPSMNLIPARLEQAGQDLQLVFQATEHEAELSLTLPTQSAAVWQHLGNAVIAGLRPEAFAQARSGGPAHFAIIQARIELTEPTGPDTLAVFRLAGQEVSARLPADIALAAGQITDLSLDLSRLVLFDPLTEQRIR